MSNTSTKAQTWTEGRRFRAWELKEQGWKQQDIAKALGVTLGAVSQWMRRGREGGGPEALRRHPPAGPSPRLSKTQLSQIPPLLCKGAECYGFVGQVWTAAPRVVRVIKRVFGVSYHETHVRRLLKAMDWTSQKPVQRASQRDEETIAAWRGEGWAVLKEKLGKKREPFRQIHGKLLVVWDGSPIHKAKAAKDFLARSAAKRLHLERLPAYAPDLNPQEGVWNFLKRVALRNLCCADLAELRHELRLAVASLRHRAHVIRGCMKQVGFPV